MQFCRKVLCQPCSARVTSPEEDMEYKMGSCIRISRKQPEEGAPENVVLFPPEEKENESLQIEAHADSLSGVENKALLTEASTRQPNLLSQPVLPDVPVVSGVEESPGSATDHEDKEELEFPHDLLPSLDFSSELKNWEFSLGAPSSSGRRKCEPVNPLLVGLQHHMEVSQSLVLLGHRPDGGHPVTPDVHLLPQNPDTPGSPTPSSSAFIDWELQEAFQECEEQMASLLTPAQLISDEEVCDESCESTPNVVHPGPSNRDHGNRRRRGNGEAANSQMGTVVFSFREYILGKENNVGTAETGSGFEATVSLDECSEIRPAIDGQKETPKPLEEKNAKFSDLSDQKESLNHTEGCVIVGVGDEELNTCAATETLIKKKENIREDHNINALVGETEAGHLDTSRCSSHSNTKLSERQSGSGMDKHNQDTQVETQVSSTSSKQAVQNIEAKKKKHRRKKKTEKQKAAVPSESKLEAVSPKKSSNAASLPEVAAGNVICGEHTDNRDDYELNPEGILLSSHSRRDRLTSCSPVSNQDCSQRSNQPDNHNHMDAQTSMIHSLHESSQRVKEGQKQEAAAETPSRENQSVVPNSRSCVGESSTESGLEKALIVVNALPLTTPTLPEVMESEGEGESTRRDLETRAATVAFVESKTAVGGKSLGGQERCLAPADEGDKLLDDPPQLLLTCSRGSCTVSSSAKEGQIASGKGCSSKMPHNLAETETKGRRETSIRSPDTEISLSEEGDAERERLRSEASPFWLLTASDSRDWSAAGPDRPGEERDVREEVGEGGGIARECISSSQPEVSAGVVSSAETETSPPGDAAESQLKSQSRSKRIAATTQQDHLPFLCQQQHDLTVLPLLAKTGMSSSSSHGGIEPDLTQSSEDVSYLGQQSENSPRTEETCKQVFQSLCTSHGRMQQTSSNQQVQPSSPTESKTSEADFQVKGHAQSDCGDPAVSGVDVRLRNSSKGNNKVHFADDLEQKCSFSSDFRTTSDPFSDCASLPPLTVHETLHHPVTEASYTFVNSPSLMEPGIRAATKNEADSPEPQKNIKLGQEGNSDLKTDSFMDPTASLRQSLELETTPGGVQLVISAKRGCEVCSCETDESKGLGESDLTRVTVTLQENGESQHLPPVLPAEDVTCTTVSLVEQNSFGLHRKSESDPSSEPSSRLVGTSQNGHANVDLVAAPEPEAVLVLSPGPMLSHLDLISDCDVSHPEHAGNRGADGVSCTGVSREADSNESGEALLMPLAQDLQHSKVRAVADEACAEPIDGEDALNSAIDDVNISVSQTENLPQSAKSVALFEGSSQRPTECDSTDPKAVICEISVRNDPNFSSDLPATEANRRKHQTVTLSEEKKNLNTGIIMHNQQETMDNREQQADSAPQWHNEDVQKAAGLKTLKDFTIKGEENKKFTLKSEAASTFSGKYEDMLPSESEPHSESQTVYVQSSGQTVSAVLECSSNMDAVSDPRPALVQTQSSPHLNSPSRQSLGSRHSAEELSGGFAEEESKTYSQAQTAAPGEELGAERGCSSVRSLCQSGRQDDSSNDHKSKETQALPEDVLSDFCSDLNRDGDVAGERRATDITMISGLQQNDHKATDLSAASHRRPENSSISVEFAPLSPLQNQVSSHASSDGRADIPPSEKQEILTPDSSEQPETGVKDLSIASTVNSAGVGNGECEIRAVELQSCSKTSDTQRIPVEQTALKASKNEEITKDGEKVGSDGENTREEKVPDNDEETEEQVLKPKVKDGKLESASGTVCSSEGGVGLSADNHDDESHKGTPEVILVPSHVLSKPLEGFPSTTPVASNGSEPPCDLGRLSEHQDGFMGSSSIAAPQCDRKSPEKTTACSSVSEEVEDADVSESSSPEGETHRPDTNWIQALKEAASLSQSEPEDVLRPLPSLEPPQLEFLTPTEDIAAPLILPSEQGAENATSPSPVKRPVDLPEPLERIADPPKPSQLAAELPKPMQSPRAQLSEETEQKAKAEPFPDQFPESDEKLLEEKEEQVEALKPTKVVERIPESGSAEDLLPERSTCAEQEEEKLREEQGEKPADGPPVEILTETSEVTGDPSTGLQHCGSSLTGQTNTGHSAPVPPSNEHFLHASPPHLHPAPESHTPEALLTSPCLPPPAPAAPFHLCENPFRSSDSDGAFETPESTTPVKSASPIEVHTEELRSDDKDATSSVSDLTTDVTEANPARCSPTTVFDENKPIAASGSYNIDVCAVEPACLTRSLSLQGGELDSTELLDGSVSEGFRPHSESFSVGTESAPGTLRRPKKVRPGSVKKKPLLRQNSNPESSKPASSSSTPEIKKRAKPQTASPLQPQEETEEGSATPSLGGTLEKPQKSQVETPPPLPEETNHTCQEESYGVPALPLCQEESSQPASLTNKDTSPIPPSASYKWDPNNFESIDPFRTGGSKIANSPVLGRKSPVCGPTSSPPESPPVPALESQQLSPPAPVEAPVNNPEEQPILPKRQPVRLEFDYSEENPEASHQASPPLKKVGKKPRAKMPLRKPKLGLKKPPPAQTEQLDNNPPPPHGSSEDEITIPAASYNYDPDKWEDPNFNPFSSKKGISSSPKLSRPSYNYDPDNFDDSVNPFRSSNKMSSSPPKASASFEMSPNDCDNENDNIGELVDQNQNRPAKKKKTPIKSKSRGMSSLCCMFNTFRVKRSPKKSPSSVTCQDPDESLHSQEDHATDEEKLASSTNHKWTVRHDVDSDLNAAHHDFPEPCDITSFVNENSLPQEAPVQDYEIEYMEKIGSSSPLLSVKKPSLYLNLDPVSDNLTKTTCAHGSEPSSPCTGSFEEIEAQISAGMKTPVLSSRPGPEGCAADKGRKRENEVLSRTQSTERDEQPSSQGPTEAPSPAHTMPPLDRLSECDAPLQYLEPDLAETNPTAFAQKLQSRLKKPSTRRWNINGSPLLKHRDLSSPVESSVPRSSLYGRTTTTSSYIESESPHLPGDLDQSLDIAREEIVTKEKEVLEWQRKYEESRQEVVEMRRIVAEYEKTIAQMIEDDQKEKSLSHHTIQQLILEKDQALADLNSVEKSLADLFRRYEKMKDVLEGFRKNEDVLKKCAQEYLSRVRKEEQRYQALKIHAEEKLDKANSEIAQVRAKAKQEQAAHQASLRKEQMKVDSLERTLEQKNKEIEELTKICDELIAKMGKS
ncbi:microtubule-associated protein futsch isoform X6 [Nothobranchius furzeri]|uniref:microtubule-associated protein futsch isoform X6 n=1 Tax=Nothobranchius furzeri TaxID=105023 RepID=UPI003904DA27